MNTTQPDHTTYREWLYLEPDGELNAGQRSGLQQHLASCAACREERREVARLSQMLQATRLPVRDEFRHEVMTGLPAAGWETRSPRTWLAALAVVVLLGLGSAWLIGAASEDLTSSFPLTAIAAVWDLMASSALAGAGLLTASWKGLGIAIQDLLGRSVLNLLALGVLVACLDLLLFRLLFRRRRAEAETDDRRES